MDTSSKSLLTSHPGKALWTTFAILYTLIKLPFLLIYYTFPSLRPHPKWTLRQALMNNLMHSFLYHSAVVQVSTPLRLAPGSEKDHFMTIPPSSDDIYLNVLCDPIIKPTTTGGTWYPTPYKPNPNSNDLVILHFHGGGYAIGEGRPGDAAFAAHLLTTHVAPHAFFLSYRLASNPDGRFPAALQDAVTAYSHLCRTIADPSRIILSGDSAGGHLAISLLRYIATNPGLLPDPLALLLWSPAIDLVAARDPARVTRNRNYGTDYLVGNFSSWGATAFSDDAVITTKPGAEPYITPLGHAFSTDTPIWICLGGLEVLHDEGVRFAEEMRKVFGNPVEVFTEPYAHHDVLFVGNITGFRDEAERAAKRAGTFVRNLRGGKED